MVPKSRLSPLQGCIKLIASPPGFTRCCYIPPLSGLNPKQPTAITQYVFSSLFFKERRNADRQRGEFVFRLPFGVSLPTVKSRDLGWDRIKVLPFGEDLGGAAVLFAQTFYFRNTKLLLKNSAHSLWDARLNTGKKENSEDGVLWPRPLPG
jgi:hypothetical protein